MAYATVDQFRQYIDKAGPGAAVDSLIEEILKRATSIIDGVLGFSFDTDWPTVATVKSLPSYGGEYLELPPHKPGSVASVGFGGFTVDPVYWAEEGAVLRMIAPLGMTWLLLQPFYSYQWQLGRYDVTAIWAIGPAPDSIVELCLELAINIWRSRDRGGFSEVAGAEGGGQIRYVNGLTSQQKLIVETMRDVYRYPRVPV